MIVARIEPIGQAYSYRADAVHDETQPAGRAALRKVALRELPDHLLRDIGVIDGHVKGDRPEPAASARDLIDRYR
ncbi:hypothetical protein BA190_34075 [Labrys sp. WJW]|nr:hypothetical protein BA190_34075 [Labrys sp. WJW]